MQIPALGSRPGWLRRLPRWIARIADVGVRGDESEEERLKKAALTLLIALIVLLAFVWVITYGLLGLYVSAAIPLVYQVVATVSLVNLARKKEFTRFSRLHLILWVALPTLLQLSLGGYVASSGVILWSLIAALGALMFAANPTRWLIVYLTAIVASGAAEPFLDPAPVPPSIISAFFVLNIAAVSGTIYFVLRYFMSGLAAERERSERLLLNVLPASTARRLKAGEEPIADQFDQVAVLFADIVDFTTTSEALGPDEVVERLDALFTCFDHLADQWGLEKIKTIGDAYMAVAGLPVPLADPAEVTAEMALAMVEQAARFDPCIVLRVGIDVGPVSAGVIGRRKFAYDLWGDTVNTASRMESHGLPGRIQVTERAYQLLRRRYRFEARGAIEVKGKGTMSTYLLLSRIESPR